MTAFVWENEALFDTLHYSFMDVEINKRAAGCQFKQEGDSFLLPSTNPVNPVCVSKA